METDSRARDSLLEARHIAFGYEKGRPVFTDICLQLQAGEIYTILGPNGAGKSTLLSCLSGHLTPDAGDILIQGQDIASVPPRILARKIGYAAQIQSLTIDFMVRDYLALGCAPHIGALRAPGKAEYDLVEQVMDRMQIGYLAAKSILRISGGEYQQVRIARVLVQKPNIIFMDEPTNHLDYGNQIKVLKIIVQLAQEESIAVVLTTHIPDHAILLDGKTGIMDRDGYFLTGFTADVVTQDVLSRVYKTDLCMAYLPEAERMVCVTYNIK
jgi:iron complex transport system ATP-binding protein